MCDEIADRSMANISYCPVNIELHMCITHTCNRFSCNDPSHTYTHTWVDSVYPKHICFSCPRAAERQRSSSTQKSEIIEKKKHQSIDGIEMHFF